jgi:hypothetical protein
MCFLTDSVFDYEDLAETSFLLYNKGIKFRIIFEL